MLGFVEGKILESVQGQCVLAVEFSAGRVGYQISHPSRAQYQKLADQALESGTALSFWLHTHARADQNGVWELYGFLDRAERELFRSLISVNGVGPKLALALLTGLEPHLLVKAVVEKSLAQLTAISGVGKKTAERLALELGEKWRDRVGSLPARGGSSGSGAHSVPFEDIRLALAGLGYRAHDVDQLMAKVMANVDPETAQRLRTEDWVRHALKAASR